MKLLYISKYASLPPYGIETRHFYLSRELVKRGYDVTVYLSTSNHYHKASSLQRPVSLDGVKIEWIQTINYSKAYGFKRILSWLHFELVLRKKLKEIKLSSKDTVMVSSLSLLSVLNGVFLKNKYSCNLIMEVRDIWPLVLTSISGMKRWNPFYQLLRKIEIRGYEKADIVLGTMPNLKEHVKNELGYAKKVLWLPHLVNPAIAYKESHIHTDYLTELRKSNDNVTVVGFAGSLTKSSALVNFLNTAKKLYSNNIHIVLAGDGPLLADLKMEFTDCNIHFLSKMAQNEVVSFLKDCDILYDGYLNSALYAFGNSRNKYVEYCLAAKPILVSYKGYNLFVEDYNCGLVVSPESEDSIIEGVLSLVAMSSDQLRKMGDNALSFANEQLCLERQVDKLVDAINEI